MTEEIVQIVLNVLIGEGGQSKYRDIIDGAGCTEGEVRQALIFLQDSELLKREGDLYVLGKKMRPMQIAKAAQFGIDVTTYDYYFEISEEDQKEAFRISNQADAVKKLEVIKRKPLILKRGYLVTDKVDPVHENLMVLFESTNAMLYEHLEEVAKTDPQLAFLLEMHQQSEVSLRSYVENKND